MNLRVLVGSLCAFAYNEILSRIPSRRLRNLYLRRWLGGYGEESGVQMGCRFLNGRKIHLGKRNVINFGSLLDGRQYQICTGNDVSIGPNASILSLGHNPQSPEFSVRGGEVRIGDRAWIGYNAVILPGVTIGEGAIVGAGAVVTKDVEPYSIVAGNPARKVGERNQLLTYRLDYRPLLV